MTTAISRQITTTGWLQSVTVTTTAIGRGNRHWLQSVATSRQSMRLSIIRDDWSRRPIAGVVAPLLLASVRVRSSQLLSVVVESQSQRRHSGCNCSHFFLCNFAHQLLFDVAVQIVFRLGERQQSTTKRPHQGCCYSTTDAPPSAPKHKR